MSKKRTGKGNSDKSQATKKVVEEEAISAPERDSDVKVLETSNVPSWMKGVMIVSAALLTVGAFSAFLGDKPYYTDEQIEHILLEVGIPTVVEGDVPLNEFDSSPVNLKKSIEAMKYLEENKEVMQKSLLGLDPVSLDIPTEYIEKVQYPDVEIFFPGLGWQNMGKSFDCDSKGVVIDLNKKRSVLRYACRHAVENKVSMQ